MLTYSLRQATRDHLPFDADERAYEWHSNSRITQEKIVVGIRHGSIVILRRLHAG